MQDIRPYINMRQLKMVQSVVLYSIFEVSVWKKTGYKGGGYRWPLWWQKMAVDAQMRATLKEILEDAWELR